MQYRTERQELAACQRLQESKEAKQVSQHHSVIALPHTACVTAVNAHRM